MERSFRNTVRWLFMLGVALLLWKIGSVYAAALRFNLALSEVCRTGATGGHTEQEIREDILFKARQLDLPIRPQEIELEREGSLVSAQVSYQVPIELGPRRFDLRFHARARETPLVIEVGGKDVLRKALE